MMQRLELSKAALRHNIATLRKAFPQAQCWPCLKANAYGHGMELVAKVLELQVDGFMVVSTTEALRLRAVTSLPILVLNIVEPECLSECVAKAILLPLASEEQARLYADLDVPIAVHLEFDSGMARTGFRWETPQEMMKFCQGLAKNIQITGMFSHYAAAGEDHDYTKLQYDRFVPFVQTLRKELGNDLMIHIDKSASALLSQYHQPSSVVTAFRPGIALYGFDPEWGVVDRLKPALSWKTQILSIRTVRKGEKVGYGLTFTAQRDTQIATLPIGYADGFDRSLSNRASVLVRGGRCPVRGRVCMNLTMIEVPAHVQVGDEVVLIGEQGREYLSAAELGNWADTTAYEILTRVHPSIPRLMV